MRRTQQLSVQGIFDSCLVLLDRCPVRPMVYNRKDTGVAKVGRPKGSTKIPLQRSQDIWIEVQVNFEKLAELTGRLPSIRTVCDRICSAGGLNWVMGGNVMGIARAYADRLSRGKDLVREDFVETAEGLRLHRSSSGGIFVLYSIRHGGTLRARYLEADAFAKNSSVHRAWSKMVAERLGRPRKYLPETRRPRLPRGLKAA
jgi:hypothetical protein